MKSIAICAVCCPYIILAAIIEDYMQNDPELNGKYLETISRDFVKVSDTIKEASYQIRKREFSPYPIFPVCKVDQPIGQLLMDTDVAKMDL